MGFWGSLAKIGINIAGGIAAPFTGGLSMVAAGAATGLWNAHDAAKKTAGGASGSTADGSPEDLLKTQGSEMFGTAMPAYKQALGTYGKLASGDKDTLSAFTGTGVNELNRSASNQIQRAKSTMSRGGATSKVLAEAPGQLEHEALSLRSGARSNALDKLGSLSLPGAQAGNQAIAQSGNLGLQKRAQNIGIGEDIGQGVGAILDKTGVWDKLGGKFGQIFGGGGGSGDTVGFTGP